MWGNVGKFYTLGAFGDGDDNVLGLTGPVKMLDGSSYDMNRRNVTYTNKPWEPIQVWATPNLFSTTPGITSTWTATTNFTDGYNFESLRNAKALWVVVQYEGLLQPAVPIVRTGSTVQQFSWRGLWYDEHKSNSFDATSATIEFTINSVRFETQQTRHNVWLGVYIMEGD